MGIPRSVELETGRRPVFGDLAVVVAVLLPFTYLLGFIEITSFLHRAGASWAMTLVQPPDILAHCLVMAFSVSAATLVLLYLSFYAEKPFKWIEKIMVPMGITPITFGTGDKPGSEFFDGLPWLSVSSVNYAVGLISVVVISVCLAVIVRAWFDAKKRFTHTWGVFVIGFLSLNSLTMPQYFAAIKLDNILSVSNSSSPFYLVSDPSDKRILLDKIGGAYLVRIESPPEKRGFAIMSNLDGFVRK